MQGKQDPNQLYVVCRHCGRHAQKGRPHHCEKMRAQNIAPRTANDQDGDFFVSWLVATTTDNWLLGYMVGGNMYGAILGDLMRVASESPPVIADLGVGQAHATTVADVAPSIQPDADHTPGDSKTSY
jgi:hypothetical protein